MAKVLLLNPPVYDFAAFDLWAKPLGLLYVAAALEAAGHEVGLLDCLDRFHPAVRGIRGKHGPKARPYGTGTCFWTEADLPSCYEHIPRIYKRFGLPADVIRAELASRPRPDVIGITSMMTYWYPGVAEMADLARRAFPGVPIVLGGVYATLCPEHARRTVAPDRLVEGPGEAAMVRAVSELACAPSRAIPCDFASLPNPAWHLVARLEYVAVLTGRGCPFSCDYCAVRRLAPKLERRDPLAVVDEIASYVERFGVRDVAFYDDALLHDSERHLKPMLSAIVSRGIRVRFHTPNGLHARMLDSEIASLMKDAGFTTVRLSLESVDAARLSGWDDKVSYSSFLAAVQNLRDAGFEMSGVAAYVMTGLPGETFLEAARSIAAAHAAGVTVKLAHYSPIPGTVSFERFRASAPVDISEPLLQNNTVVPVGGAGDYRSYEAIKRFARTLNDKLAAGARVFAVREVTGDFQAALGQRGFLP
jgi:molybdenum cofactor biosynthesis enzyme MoaA